MVTPRQAIDAALKLGTERARLICGGDLSGASMDALVMLVTEAEKEWDQNGKPSIDL